MAEIIGDYTGTTYKDFLVLPDGYTTGAHNPDHINIDANLAGIVLKRPFLPAAMRSVVGEDMALASSKAGCMPVVPRGLTVQRAVQIVQHVKDNEVKVGQIESEFKPLTVLDDEPLGIVLEKVHRYGHSNIPVLNRQAEFRGMFVYKPIEHDRLDPSIAVTALMEKPELDEKYKIISSGKASDDEMREYLKEKGYRAIPVLDSNGRLLRLVFAQQHEAYKVGAAVDTHAGWQERAEKLVEAGADMIFTDTADGYTQYEYDLIKELKQKFPNKPVCGGNIVTPDAFDKLVEAGADVVKVGMGSGSICTTNLVLGVGAPPFWALKSVADRRDKLAQSGKYIPVIIDGGIEDTWDIDVAMTHADAVMGGKLFACFHESAGDMVNRDGKTYKEYFGEGSMRAAMTSGDMKRYTMGARRESALYQGVDSLVEYKGHLKPGLETYCKALRFALSHAACSDLAEYREKAKLLRLSEGAKFTANVHGVKPVGA